MRRPASMVRRGGAAFVVLALAASFSSRGFAASASGGKEIQVNADRLSVGEAGAKIEASGNVEIRRDETVLKAETVQVDRQTQDVEARGRVVVDDPEWNLKADSVKLNLERETGTIESGEIFLERGHLSLSGRRFEKFPGQVYHIDQGFFTTCLCESGAPSWKIAADEIDLRREGEGVIRHGTFYLFDVPVMYLPYAVFPIRTERQSGFLFPRIGSSSKEGFKFEQPFFWAVSKSTDATLGLDLETRARVGFLGEVRTLLSKDIKGQINASYFNEALRKDEERSVGNRTIADPKIPKDRWSVLSLHRHDAPLGWKTYSDVSAFSDDLFLREIESFTFDQSRERDLRTSRFARSRLGFLRDWKDMRLQGNWAYYQDFIQEDERTLQQTPQLLFQGRRFMSGAPLEWGWRAEGVQYLRREGADGVRFDLRPNVVLPFQLAPYLLGSFDMAVRETAYHLYHNDGGLDRNQSRELFEVRGRMGSSLSRVFQLGGDTLQKLKHAVEPELSYLFIPGSKQRDIPIFDGTDRMSRRNVLKFSLANRFWGKFGEETVRAPADREVEMVGAPVAGGDSREMGSFKVGLSYDVDRERKGGDTLSDLDMNFVVTPADYLAVGVDTGLNPGPWQVSQAALVLSVLDPRPLVRRVLDRDFMRPNQLDLSYQFIRRDLLSELAENANLTALTDERLVRRNVLGELGIRSLLHVTDHLLFLYDASLNTLDGRFTNNRGGIKVLSQCECWTLSFSVNRKTNPDKTSFHVDFNLLGLSSQNKQLLK